MSNEIDHKLKGRKKINFGWKHNGFRKVTEQSEKPNQTVEAVDKTALLFFTRKHFSHFNSIFIFECGVVDANISAFAFMQR
ncbi:CLUMA_CG000261, isoform A [Clunio marinus]|uniref:CLUMA_CG000261, isoform A n=1 Tax=Clunio marinus TaxID=568069 RepID=A0A1J1HIW1_9DIPT|nr:CLUMA_CG000261, isoform A [Clunio marinus]